MYVLMYEYIYIYCMYVEIDYTYIDINALAPIRPQLLVSHVNHWWVVVLKLKYPLGLDLFYMQ